MHHPLPRRLIPVLVLSAACSSSGSTGTGDAGAKPDEGAHVVDAGRDVGGGPRDTGADRQERDTSIASDVGTGSHDTGSTSHDASVPDASANGYDGIVAVNASGKMVNGHGTPIQLRGANMAGLDSQSVGGYWTTDPWGSFGGIPTAVGGPSWPTYATWKPNAVRIPLNAQSFLGIAMGVLDPSKNNSNAAWTGATSPADPSGNYRATLKAAIAWCRQIGVYVILDLHWTAPQFSLGGVTEWMAAYGQPLFMDNDAANPFWTAPVGGGPGGTGGLVSWLQANVTNPSTGTINDIIFELFNEPYFANQPVTLTTLGHAAATSNEEVMLNGGYCNQFYNNGSGASAMTGVGLPASYGFVLDQSWQVFGYQQALTGIRALGATNVILINGDGYASKQSTVSKAYPTDTLTPPQVGTAWHAYESGSSGFPASLDPGSGTAACLAFPEATIRGTGGIGHPIPLVMTEYGDTNAASGPSAAQPDLYVAAMQSFADTNGAGATIWNWTGPSAYGATATTNWTECIADTPVTFSASIVDTTMTVTTVTGTPLQDGFLFSGSTNGAVAGTFIAKQLGGVPGGVGTYMVSVSQTVSGATDNITGSMLLPIHGQGQTHHDWMVNHAQ